MPYVSITDLPDAVRNRYSDRCQEVFRKVFNQAMSDAVAGPASEASAFKIAHTAAGNCKASGKSVGESYVDGLANALSERSPLVDMTVKFAEGSDTIIEGLGVPFGVDLDGESFGPDTDLAMDWFPHGGRPILYHHGFNDTVKMAAIGHEIEATLTDAGLWVRAELDKASKYYEAVKELVTKGAVGWSSGAPDHKVKMGKGGRYERWPAVEFSLTPTPAFPNRVTYAVKSTDAIKHLEAVDADIPDSLNEQPIQGDPEPESLAEQSEQVLAGLKAWGDRMDARAEARIKVGRELSKANIEALREAHKLIGALLERADAPSTSEAEAAKAALELQLALTG